VIAGRSGAGHGCTRRRAVLRGVALGFAALLAGARAEAGPRLAHISEVFSSADGSVQFIELELELDGEAPVELSLQAASLGHTFRFAWPSGGSAAPVAPVARLLLATPGYERIRAQAGLPRADVTLDRGPFFDRAGDHLHLLLAGEDAALQPGPLAFPSLPSDGVTSLHLRARAERAQADIQRPLPLVPGVLTPVNSAGETLLDRDGDGIADALDNCPVTPNSSQADVGGIAAPVHPEGGVPDGIGDACQCGDVNNDGRVTVADAALIRRATFQLAPYPSVELLPGFAKCDVVGPTAGECSIADATLIQRTAMGLPPGISATRCPAGRDGM
jgi:hypothetical protein